jgi:hypothetical protein
MTAPNTVLTAFGEANESLGWGNALGSFIPPLNTQPTGRGDARCRNRYVRLVHKGEAGK